MKQKKLEFKKITVVNLKDIKAGNKDYRTGVPITVCCAEHTDILIAC
jgi:hypothetical protein